MPSQSSSSSHGSPSSSSSPSLNNYTLTHFPSPSSSSSSTSSRAESQEAIVSSLLQILEQPLGMLRDGTVEDAQMRAESTLIPGSSVGKHLRHVHDHYRILLDALESPSSRGAAPVTLNYDKRMRAPPLETCAKTALTEFESTQERVRNLLGIKEASNGIRRTKEGNNKLDQTIKLNALTPAEVELGSTLGREMWFVCLHAIHHYALARVILVHELGLQIDNNFGVAPSTIVFRMWGRARDGESEEKSKL